MVKGLKQIRNYNDNKSNGKYLETNFTLINNEEANRYEFHIDNHIAKIEYIETGDKIIFTHTEVPKELEGKSIGKNLVRMALEDIEKKKLILMPLCPFVASYIKRNPEWKKLLMKGVNVD